jgi:F-type H+-transporting ATPase subunit d
LKEVQEFIKQSNARIAGYEAEVSRLKSLLPFEQMTMEDFKDAYPDLVSYGKFIIVPHHT